MAQTRSQPAILETHVRSLGWEDLLEKEMATHSSILAWKIPWMDEPGRLHIMGSQSRTWQRDFTFTFSLMLKLKLQYFGHQMWRTDSLEKILMLGRFSGRRRRRGQRMRWLDGIINSMNIIKLDEFGQTLGVGHKQGSMACYSPWGHKELNMTEWLNWTEEYIIALFCQVNGPVIIYGKIKFN